MGAVDQKVLAFNSFFQLNQVQELLDQLNIRKTPYEVQPVLWSQQLTPWSKIGLKYTHTSLQNLLVGEDKVAEMLHFLCKENKWHYQL
jgi:hypothetical protein